MSILILAFLLTLWAVMSLKIWNFKHVERAASMTVEQNSDPEVIPVLLMTYNRPDYLKRAFASILKANASRSIHPIIISPDGDDVETAALIESWRAEGVIYWKHDKQQQGEPCAKLAAHFGAALSKVFDTMNFNKVIVLEDDLEIAPDFFSYFEATASLIDSDASLLCVSAWNDNGNVDLVSDSTAIYRSDIFPGLGWMINRKLWNEIKDVWPQNYWDEFLRRPDIRKGRSCLFPEVSRTYTFGSYGTTTSKSFFDTYLEKIKLNDVVVNFKHVLQKQESLSSQVKYNQWLENRVRSCMETDIDKMNQNSSLQTDRSCLRLRYSEELYPSISKRFGLFWKIHDGSPRTSYRKVLSFRFKGMLIYLYNDWPVL